MVCLLINCCSNVPTPSLLGGLRRESCSLDHRKNGGYLWILSNCVAAIRQLQRGDRILMSFQTTFVRSIVGTSTAYNVPVYPGALCPETPRNSETPEILEGVGLGILFPYLVRVRPNV
jgi:hypothetical protein